ncbi:MAG: alkaline phosphatase [Anaerolineae bacterium]|nr:alkaline phosphatase [Anaerolineae bacterium]
MPKRFRSFLMVLLLLFLSFACRSIGKQPPQLPTSSPTPPILTVTATRSPTHTPTATLSPTPVITSTPTPALLAGAGDISICGHDGDEQTAQLLANFPTAIIFTSGDNSNEDGTLLQYQKCFAPSWGKFLDRLRPSPGNHDLKDGNDMGYYAFFGGAAGESGKGYYSFDLGAWHIIALNSNCDWAGGCGINSPQLAWLQSDLEAHPTACTLAYWHHPRWSSGFAGNDGRLAPIWRTLYDHGVEIVVNGHEHHYERFAPQDAEGNPDPQKGIRQFVVGTGGAYLVGFSQPQPNSEIRDSSSFGIILFSLHPQSYTWEFIPAEGGTFRDQGAGDCH